MNDNYNVHNFIALDTETTGFPVEWGNKIIEISLAKYKGDILVDTYDQYIDPEGVTNTAEFINHITPDMLTGQPKIKDIESNIFNFIDGLPIIGHNLGFDFHFMEVEGLNVNSYRENHIDTLFIAVRAFNRRKNNRLEQLEKELNIKNPQQHNGLQDAIATAEVYKKLRDLYPDALTPRSKKAHYHIHRINNKHLANLPASNILNGANFVITGALPYGTRNEVQAFIEKQGGIAQKGTVTKKTDFLINGQQAYQNRMTEKHKKALKYGIPVITWNDFLTMIGENNES